ncbi:hypothetical protein BEWA_027890 [Theileria equi strain WA]|uniref:PITH domain-containing protein n=1 Tax=Theileria equi strain WA TaxID=1537102 RepID=L0AWM4_THEEQ|nr:hypothetical protein BEWA_027890 [Theileria equi strain WA]AFZ79940.1 hypothetical protein BEWA_027890 [Theileria equi strain WA]|eukprot:XP_004829606.1 hypothetical protein BEWA_027890 [Theileria equi strain WA]
MHSAGCGCKAEHELASSYVCLREYLNIPGIRVFNSNVNPNDGGIIFKRYSERLSSPEISSDEDESELLFTVPFTQPCDIGNLLIINESEGPLEVKLYVNRPEIDFSDIETVTPTQKLSVPPDIHGSYIHLLSVAKFKNVENLAIYLESKDKEVKVRYIGLRGRVLDTIKGVVDANYEVIPVGKFSQVISDLKNLRTIQ